VFDKRLLIVSGKGGVGKSAVAGAIAIEAARRGLQVLAMGLTDPVGIAGHLAAPHARYEPLQVRPGISLVVIDRARALDEYLKLQLRVPKMAPTGQLTRALNLLVDTAPGVREIISIGKPVYEVWKDRWDLVVVDAPALGQLRSYLRAPETIAGLVPAGAVREQAASIGRTIADPAVAGLVLVTTPAELPVVETLESLHDLEVDAPIEVTRIIANRVLDPLDVERDRLAQVPDGPARSAALLHLDMVEDQHRWLARLPAGIRLPFLFGTLTPEEVAARLSEELGAER